MVGAETLTDRGTKSSECRGVGSGRKLRKRSCRSANCAAQHNVKAKSPEGVWGESRMSQPWTPCGLMAQKARRAKNCPAGDRVVQKLPPGCNSNRRAGGHECHGHSVLSAAPMSWFVPHGRAQLDTRAGHGGRALYKVFDGWLEAVWRPESADVGCRPKSTNDGLADRLAA